MTVVLQLPALCVPLGDTFLGKLHHPARVDDVLDDLRERGRSVRFLFCQIGYCTGGKINFNFIACRRIVNRLGRFENRQSNIDRVPIEDSCKRLGDDARNTCSFDGDRCVLSRAAAAKVASGDDDITFLHLLYKLSIEIFETVRGEQFFGECSAIPCRDDDVGVDVVTVFVDSSIDHSDWSLVIEHNLKSQYALVQKGMILSPLRGSMVPLFLCPHDCRRGLASFRHYVATLLGPEGTTEHNPQR